MGHPPHPPCTDGCHLPNGLQLSRAILSDTSLETSVYVLGSGELEFEEFCILAARFLIEEDEEQMRKELKQAFRFYDKEGESVGA